MIRPRQPRHVDDGADAPAVSAFLNVLAKDIDARPEALTTLPPALMARMTELTDGIAVDLDAPIEGEVDL